MQDSYTKIKGVRRLADPVCDTFCVRVNAKRRYLDPFVMGKGRVSAYSEKYSAGIKKFLAVSFDDWLTEI